MTVSRTYLSCALGLLLPLFAAHVQASPASEMAASGEEFREVQDLSSVEFLQLLHVTNQAEIKMGSLIIQRAGDDSELKAYGERMIRDHTLAEDLVKVLAKEKKVSLDAPQFVGSVSIMQQEMNANYASLEAAAAPDFRATLAPMAVEGHRSALDLVLRAQNEISDLRVRALAYLNEPVIREHLRLAEKL